MATAYQPGIPTGTVPFNQDYLNIKGNFQQLDTSFGIDHVKYSVSTNNGYHTVLHLVPQSTPSAVSGIGELFCKTMNDGINTDTTFYFQTGGGKLIQMTRNIQPVTTSPAITFLPGGLLLQAGNLANPGSSGTITFPQAFSSTPLNIQISITYKNASNTAVIQSSTASSTGFTYLISGSSATRIYWLAIGT